MVYAIEVNNKKLTFQVSGMLWNRSLVMRDVETESLWSHILGLCMEGPLKGKRLQALPGIVSFRKAWEIFHPESGYARLSTTRKKPDEE